MSYAQKNHQIPIYRRGNESLLFQLKYSVKMECKWNGMLMLYVQALTDLLGHNAFTDCRPEAKVSKRVTPYRSPVVTS